MKKLSVLVFVLSTILFFSCNSSSSKKNVSAVSLSANDFEKKLDELPYAPLIDVRTEQEFSEGCIPGAINLNWSNSNFKNEIVEFDKSKPIFIYCFSGGRSAEAAEYLAQNGFTTIYNLNGGLRAWKSANKSIETETIVTQPDIESSDNGITLENFEKITTSDKLVLVDFSAEWCGPCKKMEPILKQIGEEMKDKVQIVTIDVDENQTISDEMKIYSIPAMMLYKKGVLVWNTIGETSKQEIVKQINTFK